ncbi:flagellar assembly protein FliW [Chungangia koreensis]|uniref:Flagellar assembly factor FliW n=1 Tax=Chungangia koreensis TaxID=752657 RepID=A0ABV8X1Y9_9LACT
MKIKTKFLGEAEIEKSSIIHFEGGIPGFEDLTEFVILPVEPDSPFAILQSIKESEIGFIIAFPFAFKPDYAFDLQEEDKQSLQIELESDLVFYSIVTLREPFQQSTINLQAPVIINHKKKLAKQIVLQDSVRYQIRYPIQNEGSDK